MAPVVTKTDEINNWARTAEFITTPLLIVYILSVDISVLHERPCYYIISRFLINCEIKIVPY